MRVVPLTIKELNEFVTQYHRHHKPVQGHRFSLGLMEEDKLIGACSVGRPVSRGCDQKLTAEVTRLVTDGTYNACSMLYSASARACKAMGFLKIQTYILDTEPGTSLKASGWKLVAMTSGGNWTSSGKPDRRQDQPQGPKQRWELILNE